MNISKFEIIKEPIDFAIHFVAEALPRSYGFKVKFTKEDKRQIEGPYKIVIKIFELDWGITRRMTKLEPVDLDPDKYKWDVRNVDPDKGYTVEISLHYFNEGQITPEPFAEYHLLDCKSCITEKQFHILYVKALRFCSFNCGKEMKDMRKFTHFYRSDKIINSEQSEELKLMPNRKLAKKGHLVPGVERVPGIFFFARDTAPSVNAFSGDSYAKFPIECLIDDLEMLNFYFMDLKCYSYNTHYIAIAIAKIGTDEERYCNKRLIKLDKFDNPFLRVVKKQENANSYEYYVPGAPSQNQYSKCFIEVFFMGKGPLILKRKDVVILDSCSPGKQGGIPTNDCAQCCHLTKPVDYINESKSIPTKWDPSNSFENFSYPSTPEPDEELNVNNAGKIEANWQLPQNERGIILTIENNQNLPNDMPSAPRKRGRSSPCTDTEPNLKILKEQ